MGRPVGALRFRGRRQLGLAAVSRVGAGGRANVGCRLRGDECATRALFISRFAGAAP